MDEKKKPRGKPFEKGNPGKAKGVIRKVSRVTQEAIAAALEGSPEMIRERLAQIDDPFKYIEAVAKLLPYVLPKMTEIDISTKGEPLRTIQVVPASLKEKDS